MKSIKLENSLDYSTGSETDLNEDTVDVRSYKEC
jgi:hypothetical protein